MSETPRVGLQLLGDPGAEACEGDFCLVPPRVVADSVSPVGAGIEPEPTES